MSTQGQVKQNVPSSNTNCATPMMIRYQLWCSLCVILMWFRDCWQLKQLISLWEVLGLTLGCYLCSGVLCDALFLHVPLSLSDRVWYWPTCADIIHIDIHTLLESSSRDEWWWWLLRESDRSRKIQLRDRGSSPAGRRRSHSNRGPVALCTLGLGLLNPPSLNGRWIEYQPVWLGWRRGVFTCVG